MPEYYPTPTLTKFHHSDAFVRGVMGPVGSGKSTGMTCEIPRRATMQAPDKDNIRRTRWAIVRNTYRELKDTTVKTWLEWVTEKQFGGFNSSDMEHRLKFPLLDGTMADCLVQFRALDRPADVKKLLSLELTGAWFNEAREMPKSIIDAMTDRVERFPANCTWAGVFMDTNPPDDDHWWYELAEGEWPEDWEFFRQPGGLIEDKNGIFHPNPAAENFRKEDAQGNMLMNTDGTPVRGGIPTNYYTKRMAGKSVGHIRVYYCAKYGYVQEGKPIYPEFVETLHNSENKLAPVSGQTLYVGLDFGLTPAAVFGQKLVTGRWQWLDELVSEDMGMVRFAELLSQKLSSEPYRDLEVEVYGDPAGDNRAETDESTVFDILKAAGIPAKPAPSQDYTLRRESVATPLSRLVDGKPGIKISLRCKMLRKGMSGKYCYKRVQIVGEERYRDKPDKGIFSHVCEAAQYMMLGAGEGKVLITKKTKKKNTQRRPAGGRWAM